jgi:hypothetical protein
MKRRCLRPSHPGFRYYGGRGIKIDPLWVNDFPAFFAHVGPRPSPGHSLDRIDNWRNYEPGNVRWATREEQASNRCDPTVIRAIIAALPSTLDRLSEELDLSCIRVLRGISVLKSRGLIDYSDGGWHLTSKQEVA